MQSPPAAHLSALSVILDHPAVASHQQLLCSAARVCSSWHAAVAASGATVEAVLCLNTRLPADQQLKHLWKVSSFTAWLRKYGYFAYSIRLTGFACLSPEAAETACHMLAMAMQIAAAGPRPMRLLHVTSDVASKAASTALLAGLPDSLTALTLETRVVAAAPGAVDAVLVRLKQLRKLNISQSKSVGHPRSVIAAAGLQLQLPALPTLSNLTCLAPNACTNEEHLLQLVHSTVKLPRLKELSLCLQAPTASQQLPAPINLSAMSTLTKLQLGLCDKGLSGAELPAALRELSLRLHRLPSGCTPLTDMKLSTLSELQHLELVCLHQPLARIGDSLEAIKSLTQLSPSTWLTTPAATR